jgi:hypothetical protein
MGDDQAADDRQAEAGSALVAGQGEERLENSPIPNKTAA